MQRQRRRRRLRRKRLRAFAVWAVLAVLAAAAAGIGLGSCGDRTADHGTETAGVDRGEESGASGRTNEGISPVPETMQGIKPENTAKAVDNRPGTADETEAAGAPISLPSKYDLRERRKSLTAADQGGLGTCWAFAALSALETSMDQDMAVKLSADHMSLQNSFGAAQDEGGDYAMSMAYLLAWQGPVAEADDAYGDGVSPDGLKPLCHVQEIRLLPERDFAAIKESVIQYGGVQSSLYLPAENRSGNGNVCYTGSEEPNHDVVIVGWDDGYPKEHFKSGPESDGAFLCMNSWGTDFGDRGFFHVSYEDTDIGRYSVVYSGIEPADNYDRIYQSDLCGWTGQLGYGAPTAWFANAYEAKEEEVLSAVGFYATAGGTEYRVYVTELPGEEYDVQAALSAAAGGQAANGTGSGILAEGTVRDAGFYTVALKREIPLDAGKRFAVLMEIRTPGVTQPIAVEYAGSGRAGAIDITDGEGYISFNGSAWERVEEKQNCNLCLKAYSRKKRT